LDEIQDVLAASALELAEAILGYEIAQGGNTARAALQRALSSRTPGGSTGVENVTAVRLHPADIAALKANGVVDAPGVELTADPTLNPGDAVAEYPDGWIDARIGTAVARARHALLGGGS
jgi:flagellar assembly protein FliH